MESFFDNFKDTSLIVDFFQSENKAHGRKKIRKCYVISDLKYFLDVEEWKGIKCIISIESQRQILLLLGVLFWLCLKIKNYKPLGTKTS